MEMQTVETLRNQSLHIQLIGMTVALAQCIEILHILYEHRNRIVSREVLLNAAWNDDSYANSMALNVQIRKTRQETTSYKAGNLMKKFLQVPQNFGPLYKKVCLRSKIRE